MKTSPTKRRAPISLKKQAGLTIVETLLVMLIVLAIIIYAVNRFSEANASNNMNQEQTNWIGVIGKIKAKYNTASDFTGVTIDVLRNSEIFPAEMVSGNTVHSLMGGTVTAAVTNAGGTNDGVALTIPGYSKKDCNEISSRLDTSVYSMSINGTTVKPANGSLDRAIVSTACVTGTNSVAFIVSKV